MILHIFTTEIITGNRLGFDLKTIHIDHAIVWITAKGVASILDYVENEHQLLNRTQI